MYIKMETKIKEVHDYFKSKIVAGDYEVESTSSHNIDVIVDSKFNFCLWMANGKRSFQIYSGQFNFMHLEFDKDEKEKGFSAALVYYKNGKILEDIARKRKELEKLEELNNQND